MRKRDFVVKIAGELGLNQLDVTNVVQRFLELLIDEFTAGRGVELRNFGVFEIKLRKSRVGRNPNKPQDEVIIPERYVIKSRPGKELKAKIEQLDLHKNKKNIKKSISKK